MAATTKKRVRGVQGDIVIVSFAKRNLDDASVNDFVKETADLSEEERVLINFRGLDFITSAGLAKLASLRKQVSKGGGQLKLCGVSSVIMDVFKMMNFHKLFEIYDSEDKAIADFK